LVRTSISAGSAATSVRVTATLRNTDPPIASQSNPIPVSTGIPDQDSFSLAVSTFNVEGWDLSGIEATLTVRLADAFNNPAPDGTAVSFYAEGGAIDPNCLTSNGNCSVIWRSQNPRPVNGRVTILATSVGEESFPDLNSNGVFDEPEFSAFQGLNVAGQPYDLAEAFVDYNENGLLDGVEPYIDANLNNLHDSADGHYNGSRCRVPAHAGCAQDITSVMVRDAAILVMSGSNATITSSVSTLSITPGSTREIQVCMQDERGQPMPFDSELKLALQGTGSNGAVDIVPATIVSETSFTQPNTARAGAFCVSVRVAAPLGSSGANHRLVATVTTPSGNITQREVTTITVP
jgi:hypothetical protein